MYSHFLIILRRQNKITNAEKQTNNEPKKYSTISSTHTHTNTKQQMAQLIGISGLIGAGKTTLAKKLGERLNFDVYYEKAIDNEHLQEFYADMKANSFKLQVHLLSDRFEMQQKIIWNKKNAIQDRTIYEDTIFARVLLKSGMMSESEYGVYERLFRNVRKTMKDNTFIIHLDVSPETSLARITQRNRDYEANINIDYLRMLKNEYDAFLDEISSDVRVIRVPWEQYQDDDVVATKVYEAYKAMCKPSTIYFGNEESNIAQ